LWEEVYRIGESVKAYAGNGKNGAGPKKSQAAKLKIPPANMMYLGWEIRSHSIPLEKNPTSAFPSIPRLLALMCF